MALDAATLHLVADELKTTLVDARIDKIFQPTKEEVVFQMRSRSGAHKLFVSARSGSARACLTTEQFENPAAPPSFCMLMRKYLGGGKLVDIREIAGERILFFDFATMNELGDATIITVAVELMGRYANLVLVNSENKIIDALKRIDADASEVRQLLPGLTYTLPPAQNKPYFFSLKAEEVVNVVCEKENAISDALLKAMGGIGPVVCREISFRAFAGADPQAYVLQEEEKQTLVNTITQIMEDYKNAPVASTVVSAEGKPTEYSFLELTQYGSQMEHYTFASFSELMDAFYNTKDKQERLRQKSKNLLKQVHNLYERAVRKQAARKQEWIDSQEEGTAKLFGELLSSNLHSIEKGQKSAEVLNYYTGEQMIIPLDVRLSPSANAQKYFKEYKKKQTAKKMLVQLLAEGEKEVEYLAAVQYEVEQASGEAALNEIRQELKDAGYLKSYKHKDKKQKPTDFIRYESSDGFLILVGRNNLQNDKLTMKTARGKDMWFHTKDAPGSHVVVMSEGKEIPLSTQNEAAVLAVYHSSQKNAPKTAIDYTEVRNIKKTNDLKPGMVIYDHYQTAYITADENKLPKMITTKQ